MSGLKVEKNDDIEEPNVLMASNSNFSFYLQSIRPQSIINLKLKKKITSQIVSIFDSYKYRYLTIDFTHQVIAYRKELNQGYTRKFEFRDLRDISTTISKFDFDTFGEYGVSIIMKYKSFTLFANNKENYSDLIYALEVVLSRVKVKFTENIFNVARKIFEESYNIESRKAADIEISKLLSRKAINNECSYNMSSRTIIDITPDSVQNNTKLKCSPDLPQDTVSEIIKCVDVVINQSNQDLDKAEMLRNINLSSEAFKIKYETSNQVSFIKSGLQKRCSKSYLKKNDPKVSTVKASVAHPIKLKKELLVPFESTSFNDNVNTQTAVTIQDNIQSFIISIKIDCKTDNKVKLSNIGSFKSSSIPFCKYDHFQAERVSDFTRQKLTVENLFHK